MGLITGNELVNKNSQDFQYFGNFEDIFLQFSLLISIFLLQCQIVVLADFNWGKNKNQLTLVRRTLG